MLPLVLVLGGRSCALLLLALLAVTSSSVGDHEQCAAAQAAGLSLAALEPAAASYANVPLGCKSVAFVRHAQGTHNAAEDATELDPSDAVLLEANSGRTYWDAPLTPAGEQQARELRRQLEATAAPALVVSSSLRRALQTASLALAPADAAASPPLKLLATELCRERVAAFTCDGRSDKSALRQEFPRWDFSELTEESDPMWLSKEDADGELKCKERSVRFAEWLLGRPESRIAVVSHGHFLFHLFGELGAAGPRLGNAEMKEMLLCSHAGAASEALGMAEMAVADAQWAEEEAKLKALHEADEVFLGAFLQFRSETFRIAPWLVRLQSKVQKCSLGQALRLRMIKEEKER